MLPKFRVCKTQNHRPKQGMKGRGRPSPWSDSHLRMLIVLRLCGMHLTEILEVMEVLSHGSFNPKLRNTQRILQELLSDGYSHACTVKSSTLHQRVKYIKQIKGKRTLSTPSPKSSETNLDNADTARSASNAFFATSNFVQADNSSLIVSDNDSTMDKRLTSDSDVSLPEGIFRLETDLAGEKTVKQSDSRKTSQHIWSVQSVSNIIKKVMTSGRKEAVRKIVCRGSRTSSCQAELVSLIGRFSLAGSSFVSASDSIRERVKHCAEDSAPPLPSSTLSNIPGLSSPRDYGGLLAEHQTKVHQATKALVTMCSGCTTTKDCLHRWVLTCIKKRSEGDLSQITKPPLPQANPLHFCPFADVDCYGNNLLFFAARSAAPPDLLHTIIKRTLDVNALNDDGQSFLFVFDPEGFTRSASGCGGFRVLIDTLESRHFNFDQLDHGGRHFLLLLCLREAFPIKWIEHLFRRSHAWRNRLANLARHRDVSGGYLIDYLARHPDLPRLAQDVLHSIAKPFTRDIIQDADAFPKPSQCTGIDFPDGTPWFRSGGTPKDPFGNVCGWSYDHYAQLDASHHSLLGHDAIRRRLGPEQINAYDENGYTPLLKAVEAACAAKWPDRQAVIIGIIRDFQLQGANINARSRSGHTVLHHAAFHGMFDVMRHLISTGATLNHQDKQGQRPIDYVARKLRRGFRSLEPTKSIAQTMEMIILLLEHSAQSRLPPICIWKAPPFHFIQSAED